ncbi:MAG: peptidyl-tRNA hydrolase Pth2 [Candidatus Asgardarchaeia archaeon]
MSSFEFKQVIVVREDIKMSVGKVAAQVAHAAVSSAFKTYRIKRDWFEKWFEEGQKKVVLKVKKLEDLLKLSNEVESSGIPSSLIKDMGLTEIPPGTITALGIGPAPSKILDKFTGSLPLL